MIRARSRKYLTICIITLFISTGFLSVSGVPIEFQKNNFIKPSISPGDYFKHIISNGHIRSYRLHIPPNYEDGGDMSLVFVLHGNGFGANSLSIKANSDMDKKADEEGFIAVYPNGEFYRRSRYFNHPITLIWDIITLSTFSREWNRWDNNDVDDVGFISDLITHLENILLVNSSRIYIMGFSGGAMMTYRLGAELSDRIAAIAPIAGSIGGIGYAPEPDNTLSPYIIAEPINPIPVITFHGMQDISVPYEGGWKQAFTWKSDESWVYIVSVNESIAFWVEHNQCNPDPQTTISESKRMITKTYTNNNNNAEVILVTYTDGGHEWFKSPPYEISAIDLMWEFFEQHPK